jgi:hypothetical protein
MAWWASLGLVFVQSSFGSLGGSPFSGKARVGADAGSCEHHQPLGLGHPESQGFESAIEVFHAAYSAQDTAR